MIYNLTEKLKFAEDPQLIIRDAELTIKSEAETVLKLMDIIREKGEVAGAREAVDLLLSAADRKKLAALHLKMDDYLAVIKAAIELAMGADPGAEETPGE